MKRIAFRRILPIVQIFLFAGLLMLADAQKKTEEARRREHAVASSKPGEVVWKTQCLGLGRA